MEVGHAQVGTVRGPDHGVRRPRRASHPGKVVTVVLGEARQRIETDEQTEGRAVTIAE